MNLWFWGLQDTPQKSFWDLQGGLGKKILKMEPLRVAKNAFPAYIVTAMK